MIREPRLFFLGAGGEDIVAKRPAVAFAEQADEERAAGADFIEAELEGFFAGALFIRDVPFILEPLAFSLSPIALHHHVAERRGNKDADAAVVIHGMISLSARLVI